MEMLNAENFMRAQVTERIKELHRDTAIAGAYGEKEKPCAYPSKW